ncbi:MAG: bacterial Ig-like domain-containing protein, partial [Bacteroidales bacterium]|nr:bacterial Ig-like domain-containing protein [Bacteroidales bacterium]
LVKIAISTQPTKVEYLEGEAFSADGGEFVAYYNNNSSDTLDLSKATISGFDNSKIGEQTLKVVYNEKTAEIKVTVSAKPEPQPEPEPEPVVENPYTKPELKDGFYQISTAEELLWFVFDVNSGDTKANAALTEDIVINQDCLERVIKLLGISKADGDLTVWQPIGTFEHAFAGIFDGQGHSISGLFINDKTLDNAGLFGAITSEAVVKNLGVVDSYISGGKNVGAICGQSEGKIENCYSLSEVKGTENVNGIAGKVETVSNVENCYYLADTPNADDPQAKTAAEFKSGEVAQLLAKGDKAWKNVKELPGVESVVVPEPEPQIENPDNPETATEDITLSSVKIWSFEKTIFVENAVNEIVIIDLTGRVVKNVAPDSNRMEIQLSKGGIYIVKTGLSTKKVSVK